MKNYDNEHFHSAIKDFSTHLSVSIIDLLDRYAPEYFDKPESERFCVKLQDVVDTETKAFFFDHPSITWIEKTH